MYTKLNLTLTLTDQCTKYACAAVKSSSKDTENLLVSRINGSEMKDVLVALTRVHIILTHLLIYLLTD